MNRGNRAWALLSYGNYQKPELGREGGGTEGVFLHDQLAVSFIIISTSSFVTVRIMNLLSKSSPNPARCTRVP